MDVADLFLELFGRIPPQARSAVSGLTAEQLRTAPAPGANTIAWLIWHMARVQDNYVSQMLGEDQIWVTSDWAGHFGLSPDPSNTGYGNTTEDVLRVSPEGPEVLTGYLGVVDMRTRSMIGGLADADFDRVVDRAYDPPVSMAVRLVSIAEDTLQHIGQAGYARGLLGL